MPQSPSEASGLRVRIPVLPARGSGSIGPSPSQRSNSPTDHGSPAGDYEAGAVNPPTTYVYQYIRSLSGIVRAHHESFHDATPTPSLGPNADAYLQAHGYTHEATMQIYRAYNSVDTVGEFVHLLGGPRGIPVKELKYLWRIIEPTDGLMWAHKEID